MDFNTALKIAKNPESSPEQLEELSNEVDEWNLDAEDNEIIFRLVAEHPKSSADLLEVLADRDDWETRRNVVLNPNTSKKILVELAPDFATSFFRNPAFDWLLVEDPDLLFQLGDGFLKNILKRTDCPESFMKWAEKSGNEQELFSLVMNPKSPRDILSRLAKKRNWIGIVAKAIVLKKPQLLANIRECTGKKTLHGFAEEHSDILIEVNIGRKILDDILKNPGCPVEFMKWISVHGEQHELLALAANNATPVDILREMLKSNNNELRDAVALHAKIFDPLKSIHPTKIFEKAVKDAIFDIGSITATDAWERGWLDSGQWLWLDSVSRLYVLGLTEDDFNEEYWRSQFPAVVDQFTKLRRYRSWSGNTSAVNELNGLSATEKIKSMKLKNSIERREIACCPVASVDLLEILSRDRSLDVLSAVAGNAASPSHVLSKLVDSRFPAVRKSLAQNPSTPKTLLDYLSTDENVDVQKFAAVSLKSSDLYIRVWASGVVEKLIKISGKYKKTDKKDLILKLREIQKNNSCVDFLKNQAVVQETDPENGILAKLIDATDSDLFISPDPAKYSAMRDSRGLRLLALRHPSLDIRNILAYYKSNEWLDRLAIACNPSCPINLLTLLGKDTNRAVAQMAREAALSRNKKRNPKNKHETFEDGLGSALSNQFSGSTLPCPNCKGIIKEESSNYACCGVEGAASGCGFSFAKTQSERTFTIAEVELLLRDHKTGLLRGFVSKAGKPFSAEMVIRFDEVKKTCRVVFDFVKDKKLEPALKLLSQDTDADVSTAAAISGLGSTIQSAPAKLATLVATCPTCKGLVEEGAEEYRCVGAQDEQESQGCGFAFKRTHAGRTFTVGETEQLVCDGRIGPLKGFISKTGVPFTAQMCFMFNNSSQNYRLQFDFGKDNKSDQAVANVDISNQTSLGQCPTCSGDVYEQEQDYVCINSVASPTNPKPSCNFKTGRNVLQQAISPEQVGKLLSTGRTDLLDGFVSSRTKKMFKAMLVWDALAGKVNFEFGSKNGS